MKSFARETACALAVTIGLWTPVARGQSTDQKSVPVQPGERRTAPLPPPTQGSIPLTLDRAIGLALANNEDLNVSINAAEAFRYTIVANKGIFDPLLQAALSRSHSEQPASSALIGAAVRTANATDFSASVSQLLPTGGTVSLGFVGENLRTNSTFQTTNPSKTASGTFSFTQPLLRNFGHDTTTWLIRIAKDTSDGSYQDLVRSVQNTVNAVEQAYWDLVYALQNLEVKKESLRIAQDLNRITRIKIDVGSLAPIDITQTEVGIATAEQDIITAEGLIGDAQDRLKRQLNFDRTQWSVPIAPTDQVRSETVQVKVDDGMTVAISTRPEILKEAYLVDADRIRYEYWSNQVLPQLNFVGSYGSAGLAGTFFAPDPTDPTGRRLLLVDQTGFGDAYNDVFHVRNKSWSLGINFSYPIFNRAARGQRGTARYTWESDKSFLTTVRQNVVVEVRAAARAIDTAARSIVAASKGRELAEKNLDAEKKKFDNGMSTTFQVNQIQRDLSAARTVELQTLAAYRKALAAYHLAIADNLDWKGIRIEGLPKSGPPPMPQMAGTR
ncbi:MAG TPA: TolC family protein [Thermoanaerobaculia bacterium]|nr:TolC family protein [Thermoanaerobaculia bacterium]